MTMLPSSVLPDTTRFAKLAGGSLAWLSWNAKSLEVGGRAALRWLAAHTGLPALVVAAVALVVGYRILKKTARFALEVALVTAGLVAATHAGWIRW